MLSTPQNPPAWHYSARLKLTRLQADASAANEHAKAFEGEAHAHNARLNNDLRPMLKVAEQAGQLLMQANTPGDDPRFVKANTAIAAIRAEIEATARALEDARLRATGAKEAAAARGRLAWDARQALKSAGVMGVQ
jgi:hypothetical protein